MLALWLWLWGLSSSFHLHEFVHADAADPGHECLVTLIARGHLLVAGALVVAMAPVPRWVDSIRRSRDDNFTLADISLPATRAPPLSSAAH